MAIEQTCKRMAPKPWGSPEPLLRPELTEREGYVPNVVYTCGAMRHNDRIILPYAVSDTYCNFATINISALMAAMQG